MEINSNKSRLSWIDLGRVIAIVAVIGVHYSSIYFHNSAGGGEKWLTGAFWLSICKGEASTLFFLISGALLLQREKSADPKQSLCRVQNLLYPLIVWSVLILGYRSIASDVDFKPWELLFKPAYYHLWFLYALIGVYITLPLLKALYDRMISNTRTRIYFLVLSCIVFALNSYGGSRVINTFGLGVFFCYGMIFLLGGMTYYYVHLYQEKLLNKRTVRVISGVTFIALKILTFVLLYRQNVGMKEVSELWVYNFQLHIVATGISFLVFLSTFSIASPKAVRMLSWLSNKVFIIYFLHALILTSVSKVINVQPMIAFPLCVTANFVICLLFAALVRTVLPTRRILG